MERIYLLDTTLRDGDQAPGAAMTLAQKKDIALLLEKMGIDIIEAGFAASSSLDFHATQQISELTHKCIICSLARMCPHDIKAAADSLAPAIKTGRGRIHVFISTSDSHIADKLHKTPDEVIKMIEEGVHYAKTFTPDVEWSAEDASRSNVDFLAHCVQVAVKAGATTINLPDTVGCMSSLQYPTFIRAVKEKANIPSHIIYSVHCHNDRGLATANSLFGIEAGARQVECSINGLGERAGNAALEEIVMDIMSAPEVYPFEFGFNPEKIGVLSDMVARYSGFDVPNNKAVVGKTAFMHGSGVHQDGMLKAMEEGIACIYGGIDPKKCGQKETIVLTRHSGKNAVRYVMKRMGMSIEEAKVKQMLQRVKEIGEKQKIIPFARLRHLLEKD